MRKCMLGASLVDCKNAFIKSNATSLPARNKSLRGQERSSVMAYVPTWKGGQRMERLRHYWHADYATLLETDPDVIRWTTECEPVPGPDDEALFRPSMTVVRQSRTREAVYLVSSRSSTSSRHEEFVDRTTKLLASQGIALVVESEVDVTNHPALNTSRMLLWYRSADLPPSFEVRVAALADICPTTLGRLHTHLGRNTDLNWHHMLTLIARGFIEVGLVSELNDETIALRCNLEGFF